MFFPWRVEARDWLSYLRFVVGPELTLLAAIAIVFFATFDPKGMAGVVGYPLQFAVWTWATAVYVVALMAMMWLHGRLLGVAVPFLTPAYGIPAALIGTWALWLGYGLAGSGVPTDWDRVLRDMPVNYMWVMLFETLVHAFILPNDARLGGWRGALAAPGTAEAGEAAARAQAPAALPGPQGVLALPLRIGERDVARDDLLYVRADGHHVEVSTASGGRFKARARLRDVVGQLAGLPGLQPHRSWWVALAAVADIRHDETQVQLVLRDGETVNVSRGRMAEYRAQQDALLATMRETRRHAGLARRIRLPLRPPSTPGRTDRSSGSQIHPR